VLATGCRQTALDRQYVGDAGSSHYKGQANAVEYPNVATATPDVVQVTFQPHTVRDEADYELRPLPLNEAVLLALQNAQIIRSNAQFLTGGNQLLNNPNNVSSVFDPAIQESGVLFGNRGIEAALAAFDATFTSNLTWGRNETIPNVAPGRVVSAETAAFDSSLSKSFANGGSVQVQHNVDYLGTTSAGAMLPSSYTGSLIAAYRHPLLAGRGTEFTRIAGPIGQSFGGVTGVSQGVVIARINNDLTIAQFEGALHDLVTDVENTYWDLYLAFRNFDTACNARDAAQETYRKAEVLREEDEIKMGDYEQIRDQLFTARAAVVDSRSRIFTAETRLRRLLGMPVNDGTLLQPSDEPVTAEVVPEWYCNLMEALTNRVELRAQKWNIRSLELQLVAAHSLTQPRLDAVASWQLNGFGDQLFPHADPYPGSPPGTRSMYERMAAGSEQGWNAGVQLNVPIGFRQAHAQVRNYELRLAKARKVLSEQEKEIAQELAVAFQEVARTYESAIENYNRFIAAVNDYENRKISDLQIDPFDVKLRAQERRARAEVAYYTSIVEYNKALNNLQYRKGLILAHNNIHLREGPWCREAYADACRRSEHRAHSFDAPWKETLPAEFASPSPVGVVNFQTDTAAAALGGWSEPQPIPADTAPASKMPIEPGAEPAPQPAPQQPIESEPLPPQPPSNAGRTGVSPVGYETTPSRTAEAHVNRVRSPLTAAPVGTAESQGVESAGWWSRLR
jgi:outer membrane protein TolC